jgi:type IV pilus biogenesis protein CpaD/CtpE
MYEESEVQTPIKIKEDLEEVKEILSEEDQSDTESSDDQIEELIQELNKARTDLNES